MRNSADSPLESVWCNRPMVCMDTNDRLHWCSSGNSSSRRSTSFATSHSPRRGLLVFGFPRVFRLLHWSCCRAASMAERGGKAVSFPRLGHALLLSLPAVHTAVRACFVPPRKQHNPLYGSNSAPYFWSQLCPVRRLLDNGFRSFGFFGSTSVSGHQFYSNLLLCLRFSVPATCSEGNFVPTQVLEQLRVSLVRACHTVRMLCADVLRLVSAHSQQR
ncbi:hypothetical_protein_-_conserved [Leishmania infantum]|uniref:Hypothetical_protein_-_conserved n=1 Tax=Leishmania infantum TaxID=5671 RepID=A0A6L0WME2_LEIIN|nr:hypothetical_protein_-_conserved [Leishmania infantum]SUZ40096.1 hypothetical_protein_-_conserved [Leishmania infantum]